jgi:hypothetical protein
MTSNVMSQVEHLMAFCCKLAGNTTMWLNVSSVSKTLVLNVTL